MELNLCSVSLPNTWMFSRSFIRTSEVFIDSQQMNLRGNLLRTWKSRWKRSKLLMLRTLSSSIFPMLRVWTDGQITGGCPIRVLTVPKSCCQEIHSWCSEARSWPVRPSFSDCSERCYWCHQEDIISSLVTSPWSLLRDILLLLLPKQVGKSVFNTWNNWAENR